MFGMVPFTCFRVTMRWLTVTSSQQPARRHRPQREVGDQSAACVDHHVQDTTGASRFPVTMRLITSLVNHLATPVARVQAPTSSRPPQTSQWNTVGAPARKPAPLTPHMAA
jgi:hypothetical protein